jgi:Cdc6-like AAA superfamily ATPase
LAGFGGPANVTMNCVSFFIDAGFAYQEIAENIDDLFSRIGPVMERAEVYIKDREIIGPEMELMTHRMLMAVVKTCQHCIGLLRPPHSKRAKTKQFLKTALFHSDGDVQKQIGILITLQEQETKMASAVTVTTTKKTAVAVKNVGADVKSVATGLGILRESQKKNDEAKAEDRIKQQFKKKLGVEDNDLKLHQSKYRARRERLKLDTCAWLKDDSQYVQWSDPEKTSVPVILLSGEEGTGKSYVLTSIMQDLEKRYPQSRDDSTRISVAYFDCNRNAQSGQKSQKGDRSAKAAPSVKEMLRTWACQIMENDTFYRKDVYKVLDKADLDQLEDFLQKLFLDQLPKEAAFFLLLDETHEMDEDGCSELSALLEQLSRTSRDLSSLRIIMTTKPTLQRELESHAPSSVATIKLEERNKSDIRNYVQTKANTLACFRATSTEKQELKTWVISELPAAVNGNFLLAERKLQEINKCQDASSVRQIIEEIKKEGANLFDTIEKEVSVCNKIFSTMQVRIVNALLLWVIYAAWELQVYELESILFVQEQHKAFQPMAKEIRENYSTFFELGGSEDDEGATVNIKSSAYAEYFKDASKQRKSPDSSTNQALSKGQVQVVQHFVEKLCEKELYDKLGLAEFFDQKLKKSDVSIAVDCDNAQARITLCCLRSLAADLGEEAKSLQTYARVNLTSHLKQVDLDLVDPMIKAEIGPLLAKMFKDEAVVQSINRYAWSSWAYNDVGLSEVSRLLKSSAVIKNIVRDDKDGEAWINRVRAKNSELELLRAQKPAMAKAWLKGESTWDMKNCFMWWFGYYNKVCPSWHWTCEEQRSATGPCAIHHETEHYYALMSMLPLYPD